jgi:branched-chain amino acid transport system permease protein
MDIAFVIVNAVTVAAIYGLIAIAVSITWSSLGLINLA